MHCCGLLHICASVHGCPPAAAAIVVVVAAAVVSHASKHCCHSYACCFYSNGIARFPMSDVHLDGCLVQACLAQQKEKEKEKSRGRTRIVSSRARALPSTEIAFYFCEQNLIFAKLALFYRFTAAH